MAALLGAGLAADTCAVACLILLRATVVALCAKYGKKMSSEDSNQTDSDALKIAELKQQLPRANSSAERFGLFMEQIELLFPVITHASIFLLPKDMKSHTSHQHSFSFVPGHNSILTNSKNAGRLPFTTPIPDADDAIRQFLDKVLAFRSSNNLDWNNCCVFNLYKDRDPVVQNPPQWPVSCAASYHAGVVVSDIVSTGNFAKQGPHFLDWKALHDKGAQSMISIPMYSCKQVIAVLSLASDVINAFERTSLAGLLGKALAPYAAMLKYRNRRMEMQKIVNEIITPIEPYIRHKRGLQASLNQPSRPCQQTKPESFLLVDDSSLEEGHSGREDELARIKPRELKKQARDEAKVCKPPAAGKQSHSDVIGCTESIPDTCLSGGESVHGKRREPGIGKPNSADLDARMVQESDLDWGDFFFNFVSMVIVYAYFSKVAAKGETFLAILLCIGVASLDVVLLLMRWLWFEQYMHYGLVLHIFQIYRVLVVPVANTWMSWRVLQNMNFQAELHIIVLLAVLFMLCMVLGIQTTDRGTSGCIRCGTSGMPPCSWCIFSSQPSQPLESVALQRQGYPSSSVPYKNCSLQWASSVHP